MKSREEKIQEIRAEAIWAAHCRLLRRRRQDLLLRRRVLAYVRRSGIPRRRFRSIPYRWDGKSVSLDAPPGASHFDWSLHLAHDVNHWRVTPPSRRKLPEFGLGAAPYMFELAQAQKWEGVLDPRWRNKRVVTDAYSNREEAVTSTLDAIVFSLLGISDHFVVGWLAEVTDWSSAWARYQRRIKPLLSRRELRCADSLFTRLADLDLPFKIDVEKIRFQEDYHEQRAKASASSQGGEPPQDQEHGG